MRQQGRVEEGDLSHILTPLTPAERKHMHELAAEVMRTLEQRGLSREEALKSLTKSIVDLLGKDGGFEELKAVAGFLDAKAKASGKLS